MRVHFIIHEDFEGPAACEEWAKNRNHQISYSRLYLGETLPDSAANLDMLIIMGGTQSPLTSFKECSYFDSNAEQKLIINAAEQCKAVLGICLGAQLIGQALGGMVETSPNKEIGYFPIHLTPVGLADELIMHFGKMLTVGHWHGDMPGLTPQAEVLAYSTGCPRQIIRYGPLVYAFQCHLELNTAAIDALIAHSSADLSNAGKLPFIQSEQEIQSFDYSAMNQELFIFLDKFVQRYQTLQG
ncbi:GMP synthase [Snodgrassella communis]|jgi:GMP synthase (glutamine-hydrolysing)|uniref:glutamine amidotransferase-related protein n=1 Tax=Snodgrassella communis TaxID=2946699 RepID=UPI000C1EE8CA|nr:gamma-glutamyl-gamma-aminobutyrate hydrolase family protein [Snodgrassella communis]PIT23261.1 GMP synthase [Snodgrassella communis]PIT24170.1 GMP synthase [Snodgrassella communis]